MVVFWRGWGIWVLFVPLFWIFVAVLTPVFMGYHEPDSMKASAMIYRLAAAGLAVATVNLWLMVRYRERVAPGVDQFTFVPMKYWTPVIALLAAAAVVASFVPSALHAFDH